MVICQKCGNKIPPWKLLFLTNHNTITCPTCSAKLQVKNKRINSLIGGIGGGVGAGLGTLLLINWYHTKEVSYIMLFIALLLLIFFAAWTAAIELLKLEVKS